MKKKYFSPELDVIKFELIDIIATSNGTGNGFWEEELEDEEQGTTGYMIVH